MKILFGIQGTGNGHISRARILAKYLKAKEIQVTYLVSGRDKSQLFDMEVFGDFLHHDGLTFISKNGKIDYLSTFYKNSLLGFYRDILQLSLAEYDLVITDFEPITAWAAKQQNKPVLGIGHQYAFGENTPLAGESIMAKWIMRNFAPAATAIGLHWHPYSDNVLPPIIDTSLSKNNCKQHILVYLPFEDQQTVSSVLKQLPQYHFIQYSPELSNSEYGNISLRKTCHQGFKHDLTSATAVICNSGFELISECLHLGLPLLTKPLNGQMEQHSNALALQQLNYARVIKTINSTEIKQWLAQAQVNQAKPLPDVAKYIVDWLVAGHWQQKHNFKTLSQQLWNEAIG